VNFNLFHARTPTDVCTDKTYRSGAVSFLPRITIASKGFTRRRGCRNGKKCGLILLSGLLSPLGGHRSRKNKFAHVYVYTYIIIHVYRRGRHVFGGPNIYTYTYMCVLTFMLHVIAVYGRRAGDVEQFRMFSQIYIDGRGVGVEAG